jgi:hypothetical protein
VSLQLYFSTSREPRYAVLFAAPLLFLYEGLAMLLSGSAMTGVRNGADVLLKTLFVAAGGRNGLLVFGVLLIGIGGAIVWRDYRRRGGALKPRVFAGMVGESVVYAALFGQVVGLLTNWLLAGPPLMQASGSTVAALPLGTQLVVSLGAGLYEELLFRVLLVSALLAVGVRLGLARWAATALAIVGSAVVFSAFHYVGPYGDAFTVPSFAFRAIAGLLLSGLYVGRGFGIAAWTHALYDVMLALF